MFSSCMTGSVENLKAVIYSFTNYELQEFCTRVGRQSRLFFVSVKLKHAAI